MDMDLLFRIAKWYTLGVHSTDGTLWLPIPGYDGVTIVAYGRGEDVNQLYARLVAESRGG